MGPSILRAHWVCMLSPSAPTFCPTHLRCLPAFPLRPGSAPTVILPPKEAVSGALKPVKYNMYGEKRRDRDQNGTKMESDRKEGRERGRKAGRRERRDRGKDGGRGKEERKKEVTKEGRILELLHFRITV